MVRSRLSEENAKNFLSRSRSVKVEFYASDTETDLMIFDPLREEKRSWMEAVYR
jgi:hypothetical protein